MQAQDSVVYTLLFEIFNIFFPHGPTRLLVVHTPHFEIINIERAILLITQNVVYTLLFEITNIPTS